MFKFASLVAAVGAQRVWTPQGAGLQTTFQASSSLELQFNLGSLQLNDEEDGDVSLQLPGWASLNEPGEPELPVLRASMLLPQGASGQPRAIVRDAVKETFPLSTWGKRIKHSQGKVPLCGHFNSTSASPSAYGGVFPWTTAVTLQPVHTWRDVQGVVVEVQPVSVDHAKGVVEVISSATIELTGMDTPASQPLVVDPDFLSAYAFVYSNWEHHAHEYVAADAPGRVLVVYSSQYKSQADTYAALVKQRLGDDRVLMSEAGSQSSIKETIKTHYNEPDKLTYVTIIGRDVDAPTGSHSGRECDNCYGMMSGGTQLDLAVGRISGDIDTYLNKLKNYDSKSTAPWNKQAYGTACNLAGDEYSTATTVMSNLQKDGFTTDWKKATQTSGSASLSKMNAGLGVFFYLGHGSGTAWNTPSVSERDIEGLSNTDMPFFEIDVSCNNGGWSGKKCMGEALITARGGAISTMMSAPTARGTMCKCYQRKAADAIGTGAASRVGMVYLTGLQKAQSEDKDDYMLEAYNIFGDPTLWLAFAKGTPPSPTPTPPTPVPPPTPAPTPTPSPTPTPTPGACHAISAVVDDDWCVANCAAGFCPADLCKCDGSVLV